MIRQVKQFVHKTNDTLPEPDCVAKAIYRAASDRSHRLRYSPHAEMFLLLHAMLPDRLWQRLVKAWMLGNR